MLGVRNIRLIQKTQSGLKSNMSLVHSVQWAALPK